MHKQSIFLSFNFSLIIFICVIVTGENAIAQNPLVKVWDKTYGGYGDEYLYSFSPTNDGGYILGGSTNSGTGGNITDTSRGFLDYWIIKLDSLGNKLWDKRFGGPDWDYLISLQQTTDDGFILGGFSSSGIGGDKTQAARGGTMDYWIVKVDSTGNKEWDKDFGGMGSDELCTIVQTPDGGYMAGGLSNSELGGDKSQGLWGTQSFPDYWILKMDSQGNKEWDKDYGGTDHDYYAAMANTSDHGYLLGGYSISGIGGDKTQPLCGAYADMWVLKIDSAGNKEWDKDFGGTGGDDISSIAQTSDHGFILGGTSSSGISGNKTEPLCANGSDYWIIKIDALGNVLWDHDFGGSSTETYFDNIIVTQDEGFILAGTSYSNISCDKTENNLGVNQTWIIKLDSLGIKVWDKTLLVNNDSEHGYVYQAKDGCYVMANYNDGSVAGDKSEAALGFSLDYWIIKFCDTTLLTNISPSPKDNLIPGIDIVPNPATNQFSVTGKQIEKGELEIFNLLGEKIFLAKAADCLPIAIGTFTVDCRFFPRGIYFVRVSNSEKQLTQKLIIE